MNRTQSPVVANRDMEVDLTLFWNSCQTEGGFLYGLLTPFQLAMLIAWIGVERVIEDRWELTEAFAKYVIDLRALLRKDGDPWDEATHVVTSTESIPWLTLVERETDNCSFVPRLYPELGPPMDTTS